jgi:hypothetical protein
MLVQIDFNLFGMGYLRLGEVWFRGPVPQTADPKRPGWNQVDSLVHHEVSPSGEFSPQPSTALSPVLHLWVGVNALQARCPLLNRATNHLPTPIQCCQQPLLSFGRKHLGAAA